MKRCIIFIICLSLLFPSVIFASEEPDVTKNAKSAVMIEYITGDVLYNKNANERRSVASLVKMMGLILIFDAIDNNELKVDEVLTVSKNAKEMGGTQIWLEEGEKISVDDLLKGITMASANDAMVLMAERVSGTEEAFVSKMNSKARELGLKNTYFVDSTGLDEKSYSSAYDMALIAKELIKYDKALDYTSKYDDYIRENTDNKTWVVNTNKLVKFYKGCDGLKTGYNDKAGSTLAVTSKRDGLRFVAVSLGYNETSIRNSEMMALLDYGYNQYESKVLFNKGNVMKTLKLNDSDGKINLVLEEDLVIVNKKGESNNKITYDLEINDVSYPIKKGDVLGKVVLKNKGNFVSEVNLVSDMNINKASIFKMYLGVLSDMFSGSI